MRIETVAVHGGYQLGAHLQAVNVPIHQKISSSFGNAPQLEELFKLKLPDELACASTANRTQDVLGQRVAAIEGGIAGLALASGQAAVAYSVINITEVGDNLVAASKAYGGTYTLFSQILPPFGVDVRFADVHDVGGLAQLIDCKTKALFCESIGNPSGEVADLRALALLAHSHGIPLIADNTVPSPYLCRPIEHGADIVVHSLTQYIGGHGGAVGGVLVDSGKFPWSEHKTKYRSLNEPDRTCHGVVFTEAFGPYAYIVKASAIPLWSIGAAIAPQAAFLALQGLGTLPVRMDRICDNALALAEYLASHRRVTWVSYAALPNHSDRHLTEKYTGGRASGILSFGVKGGRESSTRFIDALKLVVRTDNIGDIRSQAFHPAASTRRQLLPEDQKKAGITEDMISISVGLEHIDDVVDDIDRALEESQSAA